MKCLASCVVRCLLVAIPAVAAQPQRAAAPQITYYRDIAPIVHKNCSPCHRPGESGPFPLLSYEDVRRHARQIADVTKRHYMPPWLPEDDDGTFVEERRLTDAQIRLIGQWALQGTPTGPPTGPPLPPGPDSGWKLGKPDLELHVQRPFQVSADGPEVFWNFIIPVPMAGARWVKAVEIRPGASKVFHHASNLVDRAGSARRHERIPGAGFPIYESSAPVVKRNLLLTIESIGGEH